MSEISFCQWTINLRKRGECHLHSFLFKIQNNNNDFKLIALIANHKRTKNCSLKILIHLLYLLINAIDYDTVGKEDQYFHLIWETQ